jgi:acyl carrier protein
MSKFYEGMAEIFEIDLSEVRPELDLQTAVWDSLAIVSTIALVDDCFNIMLDGKSLGSCVTLADVEKLIEAGKKG